MKKLLLLLIFCLFSIDVFALEIVEYRTRSSHDGTFRDDSYSNPYYNITKPMDIHMVTVAFDDIDTKGYVTCVIKNYKNKPLAKETSFIDGVDTMEIFVKQGGGEKTTASCKVSK